MEESLFKEVPARACDGHLHSFLPAVYRYVSTAYTCTSRIFDVYQEPNASNTAVLQDISYIME